MSLCEYRHMSASACGDQRLQLLELDLQATVNHLTLVLRINSSEQYTHS